MAAPYVGNSNKPNVAGVAGVNSTPGDGVWGESNQGRGVVGVTDTGAGVWGHTNTGRAVVGAVNVDGAGVWGETKAGRGVVGVVNGGSGAGVWGETTRGRGVVGVDREDGAGVWGETKTGRAVVGVASAGGYAGFFEGKVAITADLDVGGDIRLQNQDCAEDFDVAADAVVEPGTVVVLDEEGAVRPSTDPYDKRVAGVVSGAGEFRPAVTLGALPTSNDRLPIALMGKVCCRADASYAPIEVGDLLTTSPSEGHAMKATDSSRAFGTVIGKALRPLPAGTGLIPILVALQ